MSMDLLNYKQEILRGFVLLAFLILWFFFGSVSVKAENSCVDCSCPTSNPCGTGVCTDWISCDDEGLSTYSCSSPGLCGCDPCPPSTPECSENCMSMETYYLCGPIGNCTNSERTLVRRQCDGNGDGYYIWCGYVCQYDPTCPGPDYTPSCTPQAPTDSELLSPANNSTGLLPNVTFNWQAPSSWGIHCPANINRYRLYVRDSTADGVCYTIPHYSVGTNGYVLMGYYPSTTTVGGASLEWDKDYCWIMQLYNGSLANADRIADFEPWVWRLSTATPPTVDSTAVASALGCSGANVSGRAEYTGTNNPVSISVDMTDSKNNFASGINYTEEARIAFIPTSEQNSNNVSFNVLDPNLVSRLGFRVKNLDTTPSFSSVNQAVSPWFGAEKTSGDLTTSAGTATLLDINEPGGTFVTQVDHDTWRVTFKLRFENTFPSSQLNIYTATVSTDDAGQFYSQNPGTGSGQNLRYTKSALSWRTDLMNPAANVSEPSPTGVDTFQVTWEADDSSTGGTGIQELHSYCYTDTSSVSIRDITLGTTLNLTSTPIAYPTAGNCLIDETNVNTTHDYQILSGSSAINFNMYVRDGACNAINVGSGLADSAPWIITNSGLVAAQGGFGDINVRAVTDLSTVIPELGDDSYFGTYSVLTNTGTLPADRISKYGYYTLGYDDLIMNPPEISGGSDWYSYLLEQVNSVSRVTTLELTEINGSMSGALSGALGLRKFVQTTGNLNIVSNSSCDIDAIVFVNGNLNLEPDFLRPADNSCIFIANGSITIGGGAYASNGVTGSTPARYDRVEAFLVASGGILTSNDLPGGGEVADGLIVKGGVFAGSLTLGRDLGTRNISQPSEAFLYDPSFSVDFARELAIRTFSIRAR